jgi:hypothetical protein
MDDEGVCQHPQARGSRPIARNTVKSSYTAQPSPGRLTDQATQLIGRKEAELVLEVQEVQS